MIRARVKRSWNVVLISALAACGQDSDDRTGPTHPFPLPDSTRVQVSALHDKPGPVVIVGLPEAVAGAGSVIIEHGDQLTTLTSTDRGTFAGNIETEPEVWLSIRYETSEAAKLQVPNIKVAPAPPDPITAIAGVDPVTRIDDERVLIRGKSGISVDVAIVAVNFDNGEVETTTPKSDASFEVELRALAGEDVSLFYDGLVSGWRPPIP